MDDPTPIFAVWIIAAILCGIVGAGIGKQKGITGAGFLLGFLLGIIGIIIVVVSKGQRVNCPKCQELISPIAEICPKCHTKLNDAAEGQVSFEMWKARLFAKDSAYKEQSQAYLMQWYHREIINELSNKKENKQELITKPAPPASRKGGRFFIFNPEQEVKGPFDIAQLKALEEVGAIDGDTQFCREGQNEWTSSKT